MSHVIYALIDPKDPTNYRFVGKTVNIEHRMECHASQAPKGKTPKDEWLVDLICAGRMASYVILETVAPEDDANERVKFWVEKVKAEHKDVLNIKNGAVGCTSIGGYRRHQGLDPLQKGVTYGNTAKHTDEERHEIRLKWGKNLGNIARQAASCKHCGIVTTRGHATRASSSHLVSCPLWQPKRADNRYVNQATHPDLDK